MQLTAPAALPLRGSLLGGLDFISLGLELAEGGLVCA